MARSSEPNLYSRVKYAENSKGYGTRGSMLSYRQQNLEHLKHGREPTNITVFRVGVTGLLGLKQLLVYHLV